MNYNYNQPFMNNPSGSARTGRVQIVSNDPNWLVMPVDQSFSVDSGAVQKLVFTVKCKNAIPNQAHGFLVKPQVFIDGAGEMKVLWDGKVPGTTVLYDTATTYDPLNSMGLTCYLSFDSLIGTDKTITDSAVEVQITSTGEGRPGVMHGQDGPEYFKQVTGIKGKGFVPDWSFAMYPEKIIRGDRGSILFWFKNLLTPEEAYAQQPGMMNAARDFLIIHDRSEHHYHSIGGGGIAVAYTADRTGDSGDPNGMVMKLPMACGNVQKVFYATNDDQWHHIAAVWNSDLKKLELYVDGVLRDRVADTVTANWAAFTHERSISNWKFYPNLTGNNNPLVTEFGAEYKANLWLTNPWGSIVGQYNWPHGGGGPTRFRIGNYTEGKEDDVMVLDEMYFYDRDLSLEEIKRKMNFDISNDNNAPAAPTGLNVQ
jgi:hypothetical protein